MKGETPVGLATVPHPRHHPPAHDHPPAVRAGRRSRRSGPLRRRLRALTGRAIRHGPAMSPVLAPHVRPSRGGRGLGSLVRSGRPSPVRPALRDRYPEETSR